MFEGPLHFACRCSSSARSSGRRVQGLSREHFWRVVGEVHRVERGAIECEEIEALRFAVSVYKNLVVLS